MRARFRPVRSLPAMPISCRRSRRSCERRKCSTRNHNRLKIDLVRSGQNSPPHKGPTRGRGISVNQLATTVQKLSRRRRPLDGRQEAFALEPLAGELAGAAHGFRLFAGFPLGGLFVVAAELHLAENALTLHLFLEGLQG